MSSGRPPVAETLSETFAMLVASGRLGIDASVETLLGYAEEDGYGGRDTGDFPIRMSVYRDEGRLLYALTRLLKPKMVVELGCADGGSATHLLAALERNAYGNLISVDEDAASGAMIPSHLRERWTLMTGDARKAQLPRQADLIFEDTDHTYVTTLALLLRAVLLRPRCIISHDVLLCDEVRQAWVHTFGAGNFVVALLGRQFDETGLAIWLADGARA